VILPLLTWEAFGEVMGDLLTKGTPCESRLGIGWQNGDGKGFVR
jgi:hypothetical protein